MKKHTIFVAMIGLALGLASCTGQVGSTGPQGEQGQTGPQGEPGTDGLNLLTGKGEPTASLGSIGDSYIDTETWDYYVKANSGWVKQGNIKGQDGQSGETGEEGKSAYDLYCEAHPEYTGTLDEWLDDLVTGKLPTSTHTVTFYANGVQYGDPVIVKHLDKITPPADPERNGYTFAGWDNRGELWSFADDVVESDLALYARWNGNTYHVTFDPAGGTMEQKEADYTCGKYYDFPVPVKEDFEFCGWTFNGNWVSEYWSIAEDCTLVAAWERTTCQITYDYGYGGLLETVDAPYGEYIDFPSPQRDGYVFLGWSNQEGDAVPQQGYFVSDDAELIAVWKARQITVTLEAMKDGFEETTITVDYGDDFELPVPTGENFDGWYYGNRRITDESGKGLAPWDIANSGIALEAFYFTPVYDADGLRAMAEDLDGNYRLMNDITLTGEWTPIGTKDAPFIGSLDGRGHSIRGLSITEDGGNCLGLFGYFFGSFVSNVDLESAKIDASYPLSNQDASYAGLIAGCVESSTSFTGINVDAFSSVSVERTGDRESCVGGLVGWEYDYSVLSGISISSSSNSGSVTGSDSVGGLVGSGSVTVESSFNFGTVTGTDGVGGLVGFGPVTVESSFNFGTVTGMDSVGGLVGSGSGTIGSSSNYGQVTGSSYVGGLVGSGSGTIGSSSNYGQVTGSSYVGGLIGYAYVLSSGDLIISISSSSNSGSVSGTDYVGGLVGYACSYEHYYQIISISSSSNSGDVTGSDGVGGLVGYVYNSLAITIDSSCNSGDVTGSDGVGGLVGCADLHSSISIDSSFNSGDVSGSSSVGGFVGATKDFASISVYSSLNAGMVLGLDEVGGLVGYATSIVAENCLIVCDIEVTTTDGSIGSIFAKSDYPLVNNSHYLCTFSYPSVFAGTNATKGIEISSVAEITQDFFSDTLSWDLSLWNLDGFDPANGRFPTPYLGFKPFGTWEFSSFTLTL